MAHPENVIVYRTPIAAGIAALEDRRDALITGMGGIDDLEELLRELKNSVSKTADQIQRMRDEAVEIDAALAILQEAVQA